jgi:hypothetical protein
MKICLMASTLIGFLIVGLASTGWLRPRDQFMNAHGHRFIDGTSFIGMWRNGELEYVVFEPDQFWDQPLHVMSSQWLGSTPSEKGISALPEGLFFNRTIVDTAGLNKVFVLRPNGTLRAVKVDQDDLVYLSLSSINRLDESHIWPFFEAEFKLEKRMRALAPHPDK